MLKLVQRELLSCEAIVRRVQNGDLIIIGQCGDVTEPAINNRVYIWRSKDDGCNWSKRELLVADNGKAVYQTEVSVVDSEIRVYLTYHNGKFSDYYHTVLYSNDNGYTWTDKGPLKELDGFYFIRGLYREGSYHTLPYQQYIISADKGKELIKENLYIWDSDIDYVHSGVLISDDNGKTYHKCKKDVIQPLKKDGKLEFVWSEPTVVRLNNGLLCMLLRFDQKGELYISYSYDNGETWSPCEPSGIPNPSNKPKLIKYNDKIILINTPNSKHGINNRHPLEAWITSDDMKTWNKNTLLDIDGWISYPDGFVENGILYLSFEFNRHDIYFLKQKIC